MQYFCIQLAIKLVLLVKKANRRSSHHIQELHMSTLSRSSRTNAFGGLAGALEALADEAGMLVHALLNPNKIIGEVEEMRALQVDANRIEAVDPLRAAVLRRRAAHIGLR
jgi:hypothetical protein